jgi:hypothetical protein
MASDDAKVKGKMINEKETITNELKGDKHIDSSSNNKKKDGKKKKHIKKKRAPRERRQAYRLRLKQVSH